jgi:uncharacterized protein with gpF-like domain
MRVRRPLRKPQAGERVLPPTTPPLLLGRRMGAAIAKELKAMAIETRATVRFIQGLPDAQAVMDAYAHYGIATSRQAAMDAVSDDANHRLKALQEKWFKRFTNLADVWARRMIGGVLAQSTAQLNLSLRDIAEQYEIQSTLQSQRLRAVVESASDATVGLITRIPERFLGAVQTRVMTAITTGNGLKDLVPYLTKKYKGDARHAHLVALDQIRKVSESVNATRLQSLGVEEYVWMHVGGERYPRKLHQSYSGRVFRYDDPPIIDTRTGERGRPATPSIAVAACARC